MRIRATRGLALLAVLILACLPLRAEAATFGSATTTCFIDRLVVLSTSGVCPVNSSNLTGYASASATANATTGDFVVDTHVGPSALLPIVIGRRQASANAAFARTTTSNLGGPVKIVFDGLRGATAGQCLGCNSGLGQSAGSIGVIVYVAVPGANGAAAGSAALCAVSYNGSAVPERFVVPDDCQQGEATLSAPPNSVLEISVTVAAVADAAGGASGLASLSGQIAEIRVP
jgi:hypothetical protein